eukprot:XP_011418289.1 PREDICTED: uncharacterized protein LOC105321624 [Crassostrea gigas]
MESFPKGIYEDNQQMSESVFVGLCRIVGTTEQVAIRRETVDIMEIMLRQTTKYEYHMMTSGSWREGFRLKGSDVDVMNWPKNHRVIMDMSQSEYYNRANTTLILSDSSESPPGFTLLKLLSPSQYRYVQLALIRTNDSSYVASSLFAKYTCSAMYPNSILHGPCGSGYMAGEEYDTAYCLVCDFWPPSASSWIDRCCSWPDSEVVEDIISNGCHFVAIGHPLGQNMNKEWRISFSLAEQKCVYAMNHSQFLTYGLLKIFLKEVINQQTEETNELLCSYHMKTTVFWAIQQNTLHHWCPQNFVAGFWVCFKLLLKWVYEGICPNFFIPKNNMFLSKVNGSAQNRLFLQLYELYKKGPTCLLQSHSIKTYIIDMHSSPRPFALTEDTVTRSEVDNDLELINTPSSFDSLQDGLSGVTEALYKVEQFVGSPLTIYEVAMLQKLTASVLQGTSFFLHNMHIKLGNSKQKQIYIANKMSCHMLKLAVQFGCVSDLLFKIMYHYKTLRYKEALSFIKMTKDKLTQPHLVLNGKVDKVKYTHVLGGKSWSTKMRQGVARDIDLHNKICYISELIPEQQSALQKDWLGLRIPVFVMLHFLEFLCYKHVDAKLSDAALEELQVLVHHDQGLYIRDVLKDISWEILGICQQINRNHRAALYSYQQSLTQYPLNKI